MREYAESKKEMFKVFNDIILSGEIVIFGTAFFETYPIYELSKKYLMSNAIYNRSISGMTLDEAKEILDDCVISAKPSKVFLALGEHDTPCEKTVSYYKSIIKKCSDALPNSKMYVLSVPFAGKAGMEYNSILKSICENSKAEYIEIDYERSFEAIFKRLTLFFRDGKIDMCEAFNLA